MDVIVIGAGAAGLMAAKELSASGKKVLVLEAREKTGGRIRTFNDAHLKVNLEAGAEFIHGKLELTLKLLEEAGINYDPLAGDIWQVHKGHWKKEDQFIEDAPLIMEKLKALKEDTSITAFLSKEFGNEKYESLRTSLTNYIEGYYAGDPSKTSAKAFYKEWQSEDEEQFRVEGGYGRLIEYLENECRKNECDIKLSTIIKKVNHSSNLLEVLDSNNESYSAKKMIVTIPLGVWASPENSEAAIKFFPALPEKLEAAANMGFGSVIKILLIFRTMFWEESEQGEISDFGFAITDSPVTTWWTQLPAKLPLLTGWIAGPKAHELKDAGEDEILESALDSLEIIFSKTKDQLRTHLQESYVFNWSADPFTKGGYSYSTINTKHAVKILMEPVDNTLFFAGEALYDGTEKGTVEAALISGQRAAQEVLAAF